MEKNRQEIINNLLDKIDNLSEEPKRALLGMFENFPFILEVCEKSDMTEQEMEQYKEQAVEKKDYSLLALVCAVETYQRKVKAGNLPSKIE